MELVSQHRRAYCYTWTYILFYGEMQFYFHVISSRLKHNEGTFEGSSGVWVNCRQRQMQVRPSPPPHSPLLQPHGTLHGTSLSPSLQLGLARRARRLTDSWRNWQFSICFFSPQYEYEAGWLWLQRVRSARFLQHMDALVLGCHHGAGRKSEGDMQMHCMEMEVSTNGALALRCLFTSSGCATQRWWINAER